MSLFNTEAAGDVKLFRENNDKYAKRAADIIRAGGASMDLQLIKDFIAMQGLDLVADKDKIIVKKGKFCTKAIILPPSEVPI